MMKELQENGFLVVKKFITTKLVDSNLKFIQSLIHACASHLDMSTRLYLSNTGRWGSSALVTKEVSKTLKLLTQTKLEKILDCKLTERKANIICKTKHKTDAVPFHQDISYSYDNPYHFSLWTALNDVDEKSSALQVIRDSHKREVQSAVDFWSPDFVDDVYKKALSNGDIITIPVEAGDAIIFDSRLWHGSGKNYAKLDRYAYVTRWIINGLGFPPIPSPNPAIFGMFNCSEVTEEILKKTISLVTSDDKILNLCDKNPPLAWYFYLNSKNVSINIDVPKAIKALDDVITLNNATRFHDAGDLSGKVYKNLWFSLLRPLNETFGVINSNKEKHNKDD